MLLAKSIIEDEVPKQLVTALSTELSISPDMVLAAMRDRASVNDVAMTTLSTLLSPMMDLPCFSHTLNYVNGAQPSWTSLLKCSFFYHRDTIKCSQSCRHDDNTTKNPSDNLGQIDKTRENLHRTNTKQLLHYTFPPGAFNYDQTVEQATNFITHLGVYQNSSKIASCHHMLNLCKNYFKHPISMRQNLGFIGCVVDFK